MNAPTTFPRAKARTIPADWPDSHDARLLADGGTYAGLAKLSDEWGIEMRALTARWHRLRAGKEVVRSNDNARVSALADLFESVTPAYRRVLAVIACNPARYNQAWLADHLGISRKSLSGQKIRNDDTLKAHRYKIVFGSDYRMTLVRSGEPIRFPVPEDEAFVALQASMPPLGVQCVKALSESKEPLSAGDLDARFNRATGTVASVMRHASNNAALLHVWRIDRVQVPALGKDRLGYWLVFCPENSQ
jgi:hypothetical protein